MTTWIARYQEGYVTHTGHRVTLADEFHHDQPWKSPAEAHAYWSKRSDLIVPGVEAFENGLQQTDDVSARSEFSALGVAAIWRRVTFQIVVASDSSA